MGSVLMPQIKQAFPIRDTLPERIISISWKGKEMQVIRHQDVAPDQHAAVPRLVAEGAEYIMGPAIGQKMPAFLRAGRDEINRRFVENGVQTCEAAHRLQNNS